MNDKQLSRFNEHFGTDISLNELPLLLERKAYWEDELGVEDGESDEHWYAAIDEVLSAREDSSEDLSNVVRKARNLLISANVKVACCAESEDGNHMTKQFLQDIAGAAEEMFHLVNEDGELEDWVEFKISRARTDLHDVLSYLRYWLEESHPDWLETTEVSPQDQHLMLLAEASPQLAKIAAKYKGKEVTLNKPTKGDRKKYKVYVKNDKGNIVKVEFGDPNMSIKRDDPERRKNFRARHNCKDPGPKWKARYWSCKMWSKKPVGQILKGK
jgi:hypothetical protein